MTAARTTAPEPASEVAEPPSAPPETPNRRATIRRRLLTGARIFLAVAVVFAVGYATVSQWSEVKAYLLSLAWPAVVLSLVMVLIGTAASTMGWRTALANVGYRIPVGTAAQIYLVGMLGKYLPGSVWAYVLQMELGKRANLPRSRPFLASIVLTGLSTMVALLFGLLALPALGELGGALKFGFLALVPVALVCAHPKVLTFIVQRILKLIRRPQLAAPLTWRAVGAVTGWCVVAFLAFGVHLWMLASAEATPGAIGLLHCIGAISLGLTVGIVAFLAPSGLGAREVVVTAALLPYVSSAGTALGMALVSRMIFILADLISAGAAIAAGMQATRAARRRSERLAANEA